MTIALYVVDPALIYRASDQIALLVSAASNVTDMLLLLALVVIVAKAITPKRPRKKVRSTLREKLRDYLFSRKRPKRIGLKLLLLLLLILSAIWLICSFFNDDDENHIR